MADIVIGIIDGTGPFGDKAYSASMNQSFCSQLDRAYANGGQSLYERGPSGEGYRIEERAWKFYHAVKKSGASRVFLAGYSRGGSIAVITARLLRMENVGIEGLFLFDPVARHLSQASDEIPKNVRNAWIIRRIINAPTMDKYDGSLNNPYFLSLNAAGHNPARNWFGTTATKLESSGTKLTAISVLGSHGALGGVGWTHVSEDPGCQAKVANFMNLALKAHKLNPCLVGGMPNNKPPW
jgi:hypothetical protein